MLKLNASFSKKVPAELEFSSKGYSATIEVELPDGLTQEQLQSRIHDTFEMVRSSVESEIQNAGNGSQNTIPPNINYPANGHQSAQQTPGTQHHPHSQSQNRNNTVPNQQNQNGNGKASPKQIKYLTDLARNGNIALDGYLYNYGLNNVDELSKQQCSYIIDQIRRLAA